MVDNNNNNNNDNEDSVVVTSSPDPIWMRDGAWLTTALTGRRSERETELKFGDVCNVNNVNSVSTMCSMSTIMKHLKFTRAVILTV